MTDAASSDPSAITPTAVPFLQSNVVLGIIVSLLTGAAAKFHLQNYITSGNVAALADYALQGISYVAAFVALHARITSPLSPVKLTQKSADTANNAAPVIVSTSSTPPAQAGFASVGLLMTLALVALAVCTFSGCATVDKLAGVTPPATPVPTTFNEKYASAVSACTAALTTTDALYKVGKISYADAMNTEKQIDAVKSALDIAQTLEAGPTPALGDSKLAAALDMLTALQTYLTAQNAGTK